MKKNWQWIMYILFSGFFFFVIYRIFEPKLLYFNLQPFFGFDSAFYEYNFQFKQGYISLISNFLLQFLYYPIIGALAITILLLTLALIFRTIFRKTIDSGFEGIEFIAPLILLMQLKSYTIGIEFLVVLLFVGILVMGSNYLKQNYYLKGIYQLITIYLSFTILGFTVAFLLVIIYIFNEVVYEKPVRVILLSFVNLSLLIILSAILFGSKLVKFQLHQFSPSDTSAAYPAFWYFILYIGITFLLSWLPLNSLFSRSESKWKIFMPALILPFLLILFTAILFKPLIINKEKYKTEINFFASNKEWNKILDLKNKVGLQDRISRFQLNRALFMTGQMSENLFSVPQEWGEFTLLLTKEFNSGCLPYSSDLYYDLGFLKASKYWMIESQTFATYSPRTLERMANSSLFIGEISTAKKYFKILSKSLIYKQWANRILKEIETHPNEFIKEHAPENLSALDGIQNLHADEPEIDLFQLLKTNHSNKMAFEYLMSFYILHADLNNFYRFLPLIKTFNYSKVPNTYEEVLLMYYVGTGQQPSTWKIPISKQTIGRFNEFKKVMVANNSNLIHAKEILNPDFKDTFWYYMQFDSPMESGNKLKLKSK